MKISEFLICAVLLLVAASPTILLKIERRSARWRLAETMIDLGTIYITP
jgi:hypothetical protein